MQKTECKEFVECDMCGIEIIAEATKLYLKRHNWDVCRFCWEKLSPSLMFLVDMVGVELSFSAEYTEALDIPITVSPLTKLHK